MRAIDLFNRLNDKPFSPFRIHLSDGTKIELVEPGMAILSRSSAVLPTEFEKDEDGFRLVKHWRTVALKHIVQFSNLDEHVNGKRRRKKS